MKKIIFTSVLLLVALSSQAQWLRVWKNGESTRVSQSEAQSMPYSSVGSILSIAGIDYATEDIDSITIVNPVVITWNGTQATVDIPATAEGVTANIEGGKVTINNTCTTIEHEFILQGTSTEGSLIYNGEYKTKFHLNGVNLTTTTGSAIDIQCGKRIDLFLISGTTNSLTDGTDDLHKATLNCQGHLEIAGAGTLNLTARGGHALRTKEYLLLKNTVGTINVLSSVSDGIHCGEYFMMNGGTLVLKNVAKDGIQLEPLTTPDETEKLQNGHFVVNGGSINLEVSGIDTKGLRADAYTATVSGETSTTPVMNLTGGTITVNVLSGAKGSRAIACDGNIEIGSTTTSPQITVGVAADVYVDASEEENRATGIKADNTLFIRSGLTVVNATGPKSRGVRATTLTATGGRLEVYNTGSKSQGIKLDNIFKSGEGGTVIGNFKY